MSHTSISVAGNVGAVQTGDNSVANVTMNVAVGQVSGALRQIEASFRECDDSENVEVVKAAQEELQRSQIRTPVLRSLLFTIATAVTAIGAAEPALQALRDGAKSLGIPLP